MVRAQAQQQQHRNVMPSKVTGGKIFTGSANARSTGFKYGGPGNWKARNQIRGRIEDFPAGRGEDPDAPGMGRRKHETKLFITLNPNKGGVSKAGKSTAPDAPVHRAIEHVVRELVKDSNLKRMLIWGPVADRNGAAYKMDTYDDHIESVAVTAAVERGDVWQRPHAHLYITFTHYSQIQIGKPLLQRWATQQYNQFLEQIGGTEHKLKTTQSMYTHIKLQPQSDWNDIIMMYLEKGMAA